MSPLVWDIGRAILLPVLWLLKRTRRSGAENLPPDGPILVVCNHLSYWDPPVIGASARPRRLYFMAKSELFGFRPFASLITKVGAFPVQRGGMDRDAIREARRILADGAAMVIFPEGTRSLSGRLRPFFPGAAMLAFEPGVTVVPAAVWGSNRRLGPVRVVFGEPFDMSTFADAPRSDRARLVTEALMQAVGRLVERAGGPPQRMPEGEPSLERY